VIGVVPINLVQALLGSKIKVRTLDGKRVVLKVPPGTQHGQKFRIPGRGSSGTAGEGISTSRSTSRSPRSSRLNRKRRYASLPRRVG